MFQAAFHPAFKKDIKNLHPAVIEKIKKGIDSVLDNPHAYQRLKGELKEVHKMIIKHQGVEYRLAFIVENEMVVFLMFSTRENFYDYLRRRIN